MRLRTFNSIGGLRLYGNALTPRDPGFDSRKDFLEIKIHRGDLSGLAVGIIEAVGADASPELIAKARELVEFADTDLVVDDKGFTRRQQAFIKRCEDNAGEYIRKGETPAEYYRRLESDYK